MDVVEFMEQLDAEKFSKMETNESVFDIKEKCRFKGQSRDYVFFDIAARTWEEVLANLPNQTKIKVF